MSAQCQQLFSQLNINTEVEKIQLETSAAGDCCTVFMNTLIDGLPLVNPRTSLQSNVRIGTPGINSVNFYGLFEAEQSETVSIMSIDEVMELIRQGIENNSINTYSEPITVVRLAYMADTESMEFYPMWCFYMDLDGMGSLFLRLGINAQTGEVVFMS